MNTDKDYADWCLWNNWRNTERMKIGDHSAGFYVCGEDLFDTEWKDWVEKQLGIKGMGIHNCKECYMVTEVNKEYECDCILYGRCPLEEEQESMQENLGED